jgi:predicted XRE-type DNA-binding protein
MHRKTISCARLGKRQLALLRENTFVEVNDKRVDYTVGLQKQLKPKTFQGCLENNLGTLENPCPFVSCKWNLTLDVDEYNGSILVNRPDKEQIEKTCVLQEINNHTSTQAEEGFCFSQMELADVFGVSRARIDQIIEKGLDKMSLFYRKK